AGAGPRTPACAPSAVLATAVAAVIYAPRAQRASCRPRWRVVLAQAAVGLLAAALVLGNDPFYRRLVPARAQGPAPTEPTAKPAAPAAPPSPLFSPAQGLRALPPATPPPLSPAITPTVMSSDYDYLKDWTDRWLSQVFVLLALGVVLLAFGPLALARRRSAVPSRALVVTALTCVALCVALKYGVM